MSSYSPAPLRSIQRSNPMLLLQNLVSIVAWAIVFCFSYLQTPSNWRHHPLLSRDRQTKFSCRKRESRGNPTARSVSSSLRDLSLPRYESWCYSLFLLSSLVRTFLLGWIFVQVDILVEILIIIKIFWEGPPFLNQNREAGYLSGTL